MDSDVDEEAILKPQIPKKRDVKTAAKSKTKAVNFIKQDKEASDGEEGD